ncbi:MAG: DUF5686 and carboxypeptidase regulatory-like domain-containing protein, partial [Paludibacteraceae bacterium]|nr:DUF5686 and carboxypeptidase regulatory-like domain-containing protein [Paludibacteraceae bacterium]
MKCRNIRIWLVVLGMLLVSATQAVETIVVGDVVSETTGEPIANVNIHFRGTKIGTTSDETGAFFMRVDLQAKMQLVFSAVGCQTQRYDIEPGAMAGMQVVMRERVALIDEVMVTPGENPAIEILRQVRAHREQNDRTLHDEWTTTMRHEQSLYISDISRRHLRRALWNSLQSGMLRREDSTYLLPLYRERQSYRLSGKEMIPANDRQTQALILTATDYSVLLGSKCNLNFYQNNVSLMDHSFLSPLAANGNLYYRYYLADSIDAEKYTIRFRTRNPFYATFNGEMTIDTATYALRSIKVYVPSESGVNYLNNMHISQSMAADNTLEEEQLSILLDFAVLNDTSRLFPTVLIQSSLRNPNVASKPISAQSSQIEKCTPVVSDSAFAKLDSMPIIRVAKWFATIATTGYIPTGTAVDIGHIEEILQINHHEGVHIGLPFRTNAKMSELVSLEASVGYGFRDRKVKGMGRVSLNLPTERRNILQVEYHDRYIWSDVDDFDRLLRENSMGWGDFDFTSYAFEALHRDSLCINTAMRQRLAQVHWWADWSQHVETHLYARAGWQQDYAYQSLSTIVRLGWGERKYDGYFMRRYAYSTRYPVLYLGFETGHWAEKIDSRYNYSDNTSNLYAHLRVLLTQRAQLGMGGTLNYALQGGAIFGKVPATMLWQAAANQGYAYDPYRFTLLRGG